MLLSKFTIKGQEYDICQVVSDEYGYAIENHNFNSMEEFNNIIQLDNRCRNKGQHDWCKADTKTLETFLGIQK